MSVIDCLLAFYCLDVRCAVLSAITERQNDDNGVLFLKSFTCPKVAGIENRQMLLI